MSKTCILFMEHSKPPNQTYASVGVDDYTSCCLVLCRRFAASVSCKNVQDVHSAVDSIILNTRKAIVPSSGPLTTPG